MLRRLPLRHPSITYLDRAVWNPVDYMPLADLGPVVESYDHARHTVVRVHYGCQALAPYP